MKKYTITSGTITAKGNLTGYTALGKQIHIMERHLTSLGVTTQEELKFPLYVIAGEVEITPWDANGQPMVDNAGNPVVASRLTATSIFPTKEALISAVVDERLLDIETDQAVATAATSAGLSAERVDAILSASI